VDLWNESNAHMQKLRDFVPRAAMLVSIFFGLIYQRSPLQSPAQSISVDIAFASTDCCLLPAFGVVQRIVEENGHMNYQPIVLFPAQNILLALTCV